MKVLIIYLHIIKSNIMKNNKLHQIDIILSKLIQTLYIYIGLIDLFVLVLFIVGFIAIDKLTDYNNKYIQILYALSISVVASGIFYLFSIYLPKLVLINRMRKTIKETLPKLETLITAIITQVTINKTTEKYNLNDFIKLVNKNNQNAKKDFFHYYNSSSEHINEFFKAISFQKLVLNIFITRYSELISSKMMDQICIVYDSISLSLEMNNYSNKQINDLHLMLFIKTQEITNGLTTIYANDFKNEKVL